MIGYDMACAVCAYALNTIDDDALVHFEHPVSPRGDHEPVPVPADQLTNMYRSCHFCSSGQPVWMYRTPPIEAASVGERIDMLQQYSTRWHACYPCTQLIDNDNPAELARRGAAAAGWHPDSPHAQVLAALYQAIVLSREPGRTLLTTGQWSPATLRASALPKIRDRLSDLYRGPFGLPTPLHNRPTRTALADGLDQAHLYYIDPQFTALVAQTYAGLPDTTVTDWIAPSQAGLLVWATPADQTRHIAAASWTPYRDGWAIVCYRSVGADLPEALMQTFRHEIGWLIPIHATHLSAGKPVNGADPLATLITTWLLIAQRLTETEPVAADPSIRKAYARARRPQPQVRLVRIRPPRAADPPETTGLRVPSGRATPDHRYWVSGHERQQPYGPGRSLHKTIYIEPFLKGPEDKPIKASTTVRVLGPRHARSDADAESPADN